MDSSKVNDVRIALRTMLVADATLIGASLLNGQHVYLRMSAELVNQVPSIQYYLLDVGNEENFETAVFRWEVWATTYDKVMLIEKRLRFLLHKEAQQTLGGATVIMRFDASYDAPTDQSGTWRRIVETRVEIVRQRAA